MTQPTGRDSQAAYDVLNAHEQASARVRWAHRVSQRLGELDFDREFTEAGASFSELDEDGRAVRRHR